MLNPQGMESAALYPHALLSVQAPEFHFSYWMELATFENTLFEFEPMRRIVPTTITRMTASITAYSAIS